MQAKALAAALVVLAIPCPDSRAQVLAPDLDFHTLAPCRAVDTRNGSPLSSGSTRTFEIAGVCGVPATAKALAVNVTVANPTASGFIRLWPANLPEPATSTINFDTAMTRGNNALTTLATDGSVEIAAKAFLTGPGSVDLIVDVTGYMAGDPVIQCQCPSTGVPFPLIFGVNPNSGNIDTLMAISGQSFGPKVQVLFGDATTGSSAQILSKSSTSITARVPLPPPGFTFSTEPCDANGDGIAGGTRDMPTPITVNVRNLDNSGCAATLSNSYTLIPLSSVCTGDNSTPPQFSAGIEVGSATGDRASITGTQCQCPTNGLPLPLISGVAPSGGSINSSVTISGQDFAPAVQVLFGDATTGSSAQIQSSSPTSITARVPTPPPGFIFSTEPCDANGDGIAGGTRNTPTPITVSVRSLDGTGCVTTLSDAFALNPFNSTCVGDDSTGSTSTSTGIR